MMMLSVKSLSVAEIPKSVSPLKILSECQKSLHNLKVAAVTKIFS